MITAKHTVFLLHLCQWRKYTRTFEAAEILHHALLEHVYVARRSVYIFAIGTSVIEILYALQ